MNYINDTIAAISTPRGIGGIAVVRISGPIALKIAYSIFVSSKKIEEYSTNKAIVGKIIKSKRTLDDHSTKTNQAEIYNIIDQVILTFFKNPNSYTGEDLVEISCHGGIFVSEQILTLILQNGARLANPGEFTQRAFLNGKIDLLQAEAIADIIHSKTEKVLQASINLLEGKLSNLIKKIKEEIIEVCSLIELELDFDDEDLEFINRDVVIKKIEMIINSLEKMISSYKYGKLIHEGIKVVIIGRANVGKSSLFNAIIEENRAIVTDLPGTTRDTISEDINIDGLLFHLIDTAGLKESSDIIEKAGMERSLTAIKDSDLILQVYDSSEHLTKKDVEINNIIKDIIHTDNSKDHIIIAIKNKIDLEQKLSNEDILKLTNKKLIEISAKNNLGINELKKYLVNQITSLKDTEYSDIFITKIRHRDALEKAINSFAQAKNSCQENLSGEFISMDLRYGLNSLEEIIGKISGTDILNRIFSNFCIGK